MEEIFKRKKTIVAFGSFFVWMFLGTIISKRIYASGLPQVSTTTPVKMSIVHTVEAQGSVRQGKENAVNTLSGLRVKSIYVHVGDVVNEQTVIFDVDMDDLTEQITKREREIQKLELQISDIQENNSASLQKREMELRRAKEDYKSSEDMANYEIAEAKQAIQDAEDELREHEENPVNVTDSKERKKKEQEYQAWIEKKKLLEAALSTALDEKKAAESVVEQAKEALKEAEDKQEPEETLKILMELLQQAELNLKEKEDAYTEAENLLEQHVNNPIEKPDYSKEDEAKDAWEIKKEQLEQEVEDAKETHTQAELAKQSVMTDANRMVEDAELKPIADSTLQQYQLTLTEQKEELKKYMAIQEADGKIMSDTMGMITVLNVETGERTGDIPVAKIADMTQSLEFTATIDAFSKKYVNRGDCAIIRWANGSSQNQDIFIDYLTESKLEPGKYEIIARLPEGCTIIGQSGVLSMSVSSESYNLCVPLDAIHTDGNGKKYVYVMSHKESILGMELAVREVFVTVVDQNEKYAALKSEILDGETEVVVSATKEIADGDVVRYLEW